MAYYQLASRLSVVNAVDQFSNWVPMNGANAVRMEATVFVNTATSLSIVIQGSNDGENASDVTSNTGLTVGYSSPSTSTAVAFRFVRFKYTVVGTGTIIVAAGLNTAHL